jgi:hypothetical protein
MITHWAFALALCSTPLEAQTPTATLRGTVHDSIGAAIRDVQVTAGTGGLTTRTDSVGRFLLAGLLGGDTRVEYRRMGYEMKSETILLHSGGIDTVAMVLKAIPQELAAVDVTDPDAGNRFGMAGFNRRRANGNGHYVTRAELEAHNIHAMSDALRLIPGVQLVRGRDGSIDLRFGRSSMGNGRDCPPDWLIDGIRAPGLRVDDLSADDMEGIEVYSGASQIPPEFNISGGNAGCGVVVLWTKRPGGSA